MTIKSIELPVYSRCEPCGGIVSKTEKHFIGDKVDYTVRRSVGRCIKFSATTGKITSIDGNRVQVVYRKKINDFHVGALSSPKGFNSLTVGMGEPCECDIKIVNAGTYGECDIKIVNAGTYGECDLERLALKIDKWPPAFKGLRVFFDEFGIDAKYTAHSDGHECLMGRRAYNESQILEARTSLGLPTGDTK